ncbi:MAG TPA: hypothetical protein PK600_08675, partial [Deltaproteobacteria bacterium]|nr:hypothetical protein [Deltaproteobacteria bacterium]
MSLSSPDVGVVLVHLCGAWKKGLGLPSADGVMDRVLERPDTSLVAFEHTGLDAWDSSLLTFLVHLRNRCALSGVRMETDGLPLGVVRLLRLASE